MKICNPSLVIWSISEIIFSNKIKREVSEKRFLGFGAENYLHKTSSLEIYRMYLFSQFTSLLSNLLRDNSFYLSLQLSKFPNYLESSTNLTIVCRIFLSSPVTEFLATLIWNWKGLC